MWWFPKICRKKLSRTKWLQTFNCRYHAKLDNYFNFLAFDSVTHIRTFFLLLGCILSIICVTVHVIRNYCTICVRFERSEISFSKNWQISTDFTSTANISSSIYQIVTFWVCMKSTLQEAFNRIFGSFLRPIFRNFGETKFLYFASPRSISAGTVLQSHLKKYIYTDKKKNCRIRRKIDRNVAFKMDQSWIFD